MTLSNGFRRLADGIETLEATGLEVLDVATVDDESTAALTATLTVTVPIDATEAQTRSRPDDDGATETGSETDCSGDSGVDAREQVLDPLSVSTAVTNGTMPVEAVNGGSTGDGDAESGTGTEGQRSDDAVDCPLADCDATFESDHGMKIHRTKVHAGEAAGTDDRIPSYRDPERLREVYADCDSFTEMREALETDVSTQTVRRQMIAHDIYEPGESAAGSARDGEDVGPDETTESEAEPEPEPEPVDEASDGDSERGADDGDDGIDDDVSDETQADGDESVADRPDLDAIELPEGVSVADLRAAVSSAQTLYDVQQRFGLDREAAMELLATYDLLDLVHGRVSHRDLRKGVDEVEITRRILEHAPVEAPSRA